MTTKLEWSGMGPFIWVLIVAAALTTWQTFADRSVFEPYFGPLGPIPVMSVTSVIGLIAMAYLQGASDFSVVGPGEWRDAATTIAWIVPLLALAAIAADVILRFAEDTNVSMPDALRFYPAIAVFVELALHLVPIAVLVAILGPPTAMDVSFWRIAVPVALLEAVLQGIYAPSLGTAVFSIVQLVVFGLVQVWVFWRFGFMWMLGFRLAYYLMWHILWGVVRLGILF